MVEISEKGRKLLDQYWDAVIGYERMSGYINYEKAEDMALDELSSYIAALEAEVAALEGKIDQLTAHGGIDRQDDKSSNDTQTQTFVYGKDSKPLPCPLCGNIVDGKGSR